MKNITFLLLIGCALLLTSSCTKDEPQDQEYVRCLFNGEEWEDCCDCPNPWGGGNGQNIDCTYRPGSERIELHTGDDCSGILLYRGLSIRSDVALTGDGKLKYNGQEVNDYRVNCKFNFGVDTSLPNFLLIDNFDENQKIVEGRFEFTAINPCGDTVKIREGVFKVPF